MDDIDDFVAAYIQQRRAVSRRVMREVRITDPDSPDFEDEVLLDATICWGLTDNVMAILTNSQPTSLSTFTDVTIALQRGEVVLAFQDDVAESWDHWFVLVGAGDTTYLLEYASGAPIDVYRDTTTRMIELLQAVSEGRCMDRCYRRISQHRFTFWTHQRRAMNGQTVDEFVHGISDVV